MKKFWIIALFLAMCGAVYGTEGLKLPDSLKIGVYNNPPKLTISPDGTVSGFHISLLDAILEGTGIRKEYVVDTWDDIVAKLERGEIDMLLDMAYSEERSHNFDFTSVSVITNWGVVYTSQLSSINSITDLDGTRVAVMKDSIYASGEQGVKKLAQEFGITIDILELESQEECFAAIRNGMADAAVVNRLFGLMNEVGGNPHRTSISFSPSQIRYAFPKGAAYNQALITLIDTRLSALISTPNSAYHQAFDTFLKPQISKEAETQALIGRLSLVGIGLLFLILVVIYVMKIGRRDKIQIEQFYSNLQSMGDIRESIVDSSLAAYSIFALPLGFLALHYAFTVGGDPFIWFFVPAQIVPIFHVFFKKRVNLALKTTGLMGFLLISGTVITLARGNSGIGFSYFFLAAILASILQGRRLGIATLTLGLLVTLLTLVLSYIGVLQPFSTNPSFFLSPRSWPFSVLSFFMLFFAVLGGINKFYDSLTKAVLNLEEGIAERTKDIKYINQELKKEISEHMATEDKLRAARQEAEEANRTKSSFFAGISHEIRTPLNAILGYSQILMRDRTLSQESLRQIETINTSGEHLLGLINEVLEMSRIEAGKIQLDIAPCQPLVILDEIRSLFSGQASRKGLAFSITAHEDLPACVKTDRSKLKQILINLVGNAIKFTDSGSIEIYAARSAQAVDELEFSVRDTGKGIPATALPRLFQPFEQTKEGRSQGGTGLGLAICKTYCELLEGKIRVKSKPGKGSTFSFTIRAPDCEEGILHDQALASKVLSIASPKAPSILVVDDKAINRDIVDKMLSPIGFAVEQAENGESAIEAFRARPFDIAILDLVMPGISSRELIQALRDLPGGRKLGVIVMTGSLQENQKIDINALGADGLLAKPVDETLLLAEIKRLACIEYSCIDDQEGQNTALLQNEELLYRLTLIPDSMAKKLRDSIISGDLEEVAQIAKEISGLDKNLGETLNELSEKFQMDRLLMLTNGKE